MTHKSTTDTYELQSEIIRLRRRVERERAARTEAETIAERGLRELYRNNQDLDRLVQQRVAEGARLARRAALAERVKAEILGTFSHELRTPLMAVIGALDLLYDDVVPDEDPNCKCWQESEVFLRAAIDGASRLRDLVDDLLVVADLGHDQSEIDTEPVSLALFVEEMTNKWKLPALKAGLLLVSSIANCVGSAMIDAEVTKAALDRLLDNAIRYSDSGKVTLDVSASSNEIVFVVADEGPGIAPEHVVSFLEPFEMGDRSSTRSRGGLGLGLTIARGLIQAQDGQIHIESELGAGTRIMVTLPLHPSSPVAEES